MYLPTLQSDQLYSWSDGYTKAAYSRLAKTPQSSSAPIATAAGHPSRFPDRALQTLRQARMQMRRGPWPRPQVLSVGKLPRPAAANGLCPAGILCPNERVSRQLSTSPRDPGVDLRDQSRTATPSRGSLKNRHEAITSSPPRPDRCGVRWCVARQYARRLARQHLKDFIPCGGG